MGRTFEHNGLTRDISLGHLTDEEMADSVRMLMRGDLDHEIICCAARDRIKCLMYEKERLLELVRAVRGHEHIELLEIDQRGWFERRDEILKDMEEC